MPNEPSPRTMRKFAHKAGGLPISAVSTAVLIIGLGFGTAALSQDRGTIADLKFSKQELELLKRLDQIQAGAKLSSTMLKAAPFIELFNSPDPVDVAITIGGNDWDKIYGALSGLKKIQSCKTSEAITLWRDVDGNSYSGKKTEQFFENIQKQADSGCG